VIYFTRQEQRIIILLGTVMLLGTGVLLVKRFQPGWIMRLSMGEPDFDVQKDQKSPRLESVASMSTDQPMQKRQSDQSTRNDTPISTDRPAQKQRLDQSRKSDVEAGTSRPQAKININTANEEELESLPGIGPVLAQRIIDYRQEHGKFANIYELTHVYGIGSATLRKLEDRITVRDGDESE
jgi:comEA protein